MTEEEKTKLRFLIAFLGYKFIKFVAGLRVNQIPHVCPEDPSCCRDHPTPQSLWFAASHFINVHAGSFQLVVTYFAFPTTVEENYAKNLL